MAVETIIEGISEYFLKCPLLKDGVFRVDALGPDPVEYTIETGTFDPIVQKYVDGSSIRQYQFSFGSREYYDMDRLQNIENIMFYEKIAAWVEEQSKKGNLPERPEGMETETMGVLDPGYSVNTGMTTAGYKRDLRLV